MSSSPAAPIALPSARAASVCAGSKPALEPQKTQSARIMTVKSASAGGVA